MRLLISKYTTVKQAKEAFSSWFPNLKIEFYHYQHLPGMSSVPDPQLRDDVYLWEVSDRMDEGYLDIPPGMLVSSFEQKMQSSFGLPVQVFRRIGSVWIETIASDGLTLERLNQLAAPPRRTYRFNEHSLLL
jgi:hypothetical protein